MKLLRTAACVLAWGFWSEGTPAQDVPIFEADVESVYVDVFVTNKGKSAQRLTDRDFELRDNGVQQAVRIVSLEAIPLRAVLVFDASSSVAGEKLRHLRSAGRAFLNELQRDDEPSLLTFSHEIRLREPPPKPHSLADTLDRVRPQGGTSLLDALFAALKLVERSAGRPVIIVFTDGEDNMSWLGEAELVELAEESNALIYAVGIVDEGRLAVGGRVGIDGHSRTHWQPASERSEFLREIASISGGRAWDVKSSSRLEKAFLQILDELHSRYLLTYSPEGVDEPGWHELQVRLKNRKTKVRARRGYYRSRATSDNLGGANSP